MKRWSNTRILGLCGLTAAIIETASGPLGVWMPRLGFILHGVASAVMLGANLVLIFRVEHRG